MYTRCYFRWWPGDARNQDMSSHVMTLVCGNIPVSVRNRVQHLWGYHQRPSDFNIDSLVQDCSNSSALALALELLQSCAKPSIFFSMHIPYNLITPKCLYLSGWETLRPVTYGKKWAMTFTSPGTSSVLPCVTAMPYWTYHVTHQNSPRAWKTVPPACWNWNSFKLPLVTALVVSTSHNQCIYRYLVAATVDPAYIIDKKACSTLNHQSLRADITVQRVG